MERAIVGFETDEGGDWVAVLRCGHRQHVRHKPPFQDRPWTLTTLGRASRVGTPLNCVLCERSRTPRTRAAAPPAWPTRSVPNAAASTATVPAVPSSYRSERSEPGLRRPWSSRCSPMTRSSASASASRTVGRRRIDDQPLVGVEELERVAVEGELADLGMANRLATRPSLRRTRLRPQLGEARRRAQQVVEQSAQSRVLGIASGHRPQVGHGLRRRPRVLLGRSRDAPLGSQEALPHDVALRAATTPRSPPGERRPSRSRPARRPWRRGPAPGDRPAARGCASCSPARRHRSGRPAAG